jgi:hypothetical protein
MRKIPLLGLPVSLLLVAVLLVAAITAPAVLATSTPMLTWGTVTLDGSAAPVGTIVDVYIGADTAASGSFTVATAGQYGSIQVWADDTRYGEALTFEVGGFLATKQGPDDGVFGLANQVVNLAAVSGPQPPSVTTGAVSGLTHDSATLNGNLDIGAYSTANVYFEYGTSTAYGMSTSMMAMTASGAFSAPVSGLTPSSLYHFRAVVSYDSTVSNGADMTFATLAGPAWPKTKTLINGWNVISTSVWLDEDSDRTDDILSGTYEGYRWGGTSWKTLSKSYTWEPLEAFYIKVTGTATATFVPSLDMMAPNDRKLSSNKWALIGSSPIYGVSSMTMDKVLEGLKGNFVNVIVPALNLNGSGGSATAANANQLSVPAFGGAWVFVGGESTRTIVGFYGFSPVVQ